MGVNAKIKTANAKIKTANAKVKTALPVGNNFSIDKSPLIFIKINGTLLIPINPHCPLIAKVLTLPIQKNLLVI